MYLVDFMHKTNAKDLKTWMETVMEDSVMVALYYCSENIYTNIYQLYD